jgi:hypothetical protein
MTTQLTRVFSILLLFAPCPSSVNAQTRERADVPEQYKWNLGDIYDSDEAWTAAKDALATRFDEITAFEGKLTESPEQLLACLELNSEIDQELSKLFSYASMKSDQDTRVSEYQGKKQMLQKLATEYSAKASFIAPEITALDEAAIDDFIGSGDLQYVFARHPAHQSAPVVGQRRENIGGDRPDGIGTIVNLLDLCQRRIAFRGNYVVRWHRGHIESGQFFQVSSDPQP